MRVVLEIIFSKWGLAVVTVLASAINGYIERLFGGNWAMVITISLATAAFTTYLYQSYVLVNPPQSVRVSRLQKNLDKWLMSFKANPKEVKTLGNDLLLHYDYHYSDEPQSVVVMKIGRVQIFQKTKYPDHVKWMNSLDAAKREQAISEIDKAMWGLQVEFGAIFGPKDSELTMQRTFELNKFERNELFQGIVEVHRATEQIVHVLTRQVKYGLCNGNG